MNMLEYEVTITTKDRSYTFNVVAKSKEEAEAKAKKKLRYKRALNDAAIDLKNNILYKPEVGLKATWRHLMPWSNTNVVNAGRSSLNMGSYKAGTIFKSVIATLKNGKSNRQLAELTNEEITLVKKQKYVDFAIYTGLLILGLFYFFWGINNWSDNQFYLRFFNPYFVSGVGLISYTAIFLTITLRDVFNILKWEEAHGH